MEEVHQGRVTSADFTRVHPAMWSTALCERVHKGQTQVAISFCRCLVATCVFSPLFLDNIKEDVNTLLIQGFQRPVWPSAAKGLSVPVLSYGAWQKSNLSLSALLILHRQRRKIILSTEYFSTFYFYFWESLEEVTFSLTTRWSLRPTFYA